MSSRGSWPIRGRAPPEWWAGSQRVEEIVVCRSPFIHPRQVITMRGGRAAARRSVEKVEEMFLSVFMGRDVRSQMLICLLTSPLPVPPPTPTLPIQTSVLPPLLWLQKLDVGRQFSSQRRTKK